MRASWTARIIVAGLLLAAHALAAPTITWTLAAKLPAAKAGAACGVIDGKALVAGGACWRGSQRLWSGDLDIYDPAADAWAKGPAMPFPLTGGASAVVGGRLYVISGSDGKRDYRETMICARIGGRYQWLWGPKLPAPRLYAATAVIGTRLYLIGGAPDFEMTGKFYEDLLTLDTAQPEEGWQALRRLPGAGRAMMAAAAIGESIYAFGGCRKTPDGMCNCDDAFVYDTLRNRWQRLSFAPYAARGWDALALNGQVYLFGGQVTFPSALGRPDGYSDKIIRYDPEAGEYSSAGDLPVPALGISPQLLSDGRVFIAGGEDAPSHCTAAAAVGTLR